jgi:mono/diheme cytochrome c family protein
LAINRRNLSLCIALSGLVAAIACTAEGDTPETLVDKAAVATGAATPSPAVIELGRGIYKKNCVPCHGETGKGDGPGAGVLKPPPRDHTDRAYMSTLTDKNIADVIQMGGAIKGRPLMPSHPHIRGTDMDALVAYIRTLAK